ncbi:hypothetical protein FK220_000965 [Flavobacteriaceae bacterium TP-CH-4]|uniref:Uncharacterized protein n=1 Tax=Pelagihabitans pacificus TaxID=2696054 RepID=A0A967AQ11_9FLAO|nr:hypothetical protein [Pelagihabitans pacificus]NHF57892.1 hypothetical protein [Pelagihabitans pacificus]
MKALHIVSYALIFVLFSAFKPSEACEYAGSNITFVKTQTEKAISKNDLNLTKYHVYKALNAIEKSKKQMKDCGCDYAAIGIEESSYLLKRATKANSLKDSKKLLSRALENTLESLEALEKHDKHTGHSEAYLAINSIEKEASSVPLVQKPSEAQMKRRIDIALEKYRESLNTVVETVDCKDAKAFAERIYQECERALLNADLSEGKKYYNLQTQKITAEALERIGDCKQ